MPPRITLINKLAKHATSVYDETKNLVGHSVAEAHNPAARYKTVARQYLVMLSDAFTGFQGIRTGS